MRSWCVYQKVLNLATLNEQDQVRYDTRGHGRSGKPTTDEAWESRRISEDFEAVCKEFDIKEAFVLGWSVGCELILFNISVKRARKLTSQLPISWTLQPITPQLRSLDWSMCRARFISNRLLLRAPPTTRTLWS